jgi:uncharacterized protein YuzE
MKKESWYDREEDIMGIQLYKGHYWKSVELPQGIVIDVSKSGKIMGIEIPNAKKIFSGKTKKVLEQAKAR